jgi:Uma2 family endonuclease
MPRMVIIDEDFADRFRKEREATDGWRFDEVWNGTYYWMPLPDNEHQRLIGLIATVCGIDYPFDGTTPRPFIAMNPAVSDAKDYRTNYRCPDVVVYLLGNPAKDRKTHMQGGPDFLCEVLIPEDVSREKLPFYASIGTKEVLIVDRDPWQLELYQLRRGKLRLAGEVRPGEGKSLASGVVPLTFALVRGRPRPKIRITHRETEQEWTF